LPTLFDAAFNDSDGSVLRHGVMRRLSCARPDPALPGGPPALTPDRIVDSNRPGETGPGRLTTAGGPVSAPVSPLRIQMGEETTGCVPVFQQVGVAFRTLSWLEEPELG